MLGHVLDQLLRLLHPVIPFVTEELWIALTGGEHGGQAPPGRRPTGAASTTPPRPRWTALQRVVTEVRRFRSDQGLRPAQRVAARLDGLAAAGLAAHEPLIRSLARLDDAGDDFAATATLAVAGGVTRRRWTPAASIDVAAERARLTKDRAAAEKEVAQCRAQARQRGVHRQGAGAGRRRRSASGWPRPRPTWPGSTRALAGAAAHEPTADAAEFAARSTPTLDARAATPGWSSTSGRIEALLDLLGSPQRAYPSIHLTGTNGKTSTARMIDSLLRALRPAHRPLHQPAPGDGARADQPRRASRSARSGSSRSTARSSRWPRWSTSEHDEPLTYFDMTTALAFAAFADAPVDVAVVEVGLGGADDSTNVLQAGVCVITPIGLDHTEWLGDTLEDIALAKAGIIHKGATRDLRRADRGGRCGRSCERCAEVGATIAREGGEFGVLRRTLAVGGQVLTLQGLGGVYDEIFLPLHGAHQAQNAAVALAAVEAFLGAGADRQLDVEVVREGFAGRQSPGRLERVRNAPTILLDAAHNPHGMAATVTALQEEFAFSRLVAVVAVLGRQGRATACWSCSSRWSTRSWSPATRSPRAMPVDELAALAAEVFGEDRVRRRPTTCPTRSRPRWRWPRTDVQGELERRGRAGDRLGGHRGRRAEAAEAMTTPDDTRPEADAAADAGRAAAGLPAVRVAQPGRRGARHGLRGARPGRDRAAAGDPADPGARR